MALNKPKESLKDFKAVLVKHPRDRNAQTKFTECQALVRRIMFAEAISTPDRRKSVIKEVSLENMSVSDSYEGPRLATPETKPDEKFLKTADNTSNGVMSVIVNFTHVRTVE